MVTLPASLGGGVASELCAASHVQRSANVWEMRGPPSGSGFYWCGLITKNADSTITAAFRLNSTAPSRCDEATLPDAQALNLPFTWNPAQTYSCPAVAAPVPAAWQGDAVTSVPTVGGGAPSVIREIITSTAAIECTGGVQASQCQATCIASATTATTTAPGSSAAVTVLRTEFGVSGSIIQCDWLRLLTPVETGVANSYTMDHIMGSFGATGPACPTAIPADGAGVRPVRARSEDGFAEAWWCGIVVVDHAAV